MSRPIWLVALFALALAALVGSHAPFAGAEGFKKIFVVENIPRTATGKILRRAVAALLCGKEQTA